MHAIYKRQKQETNGKVIGFSPQCSVAKGWDLITYGWQASHTPDNKYDGESAEGSVMNSRKDI